MAEQYSPLEVERIGSTMSSSNPDGLTDPHVRAIELTTKQFEVIFQVAHQLRNFPESRLASLGSTAVDLDYLIGLLGSINDHLEGHSRIRIDVSVADSDASAAHLVERSGDGSPTGTLCGILPWGIAARLRPLTEMVVSSLGPRELFLRTGYTFDEVREAMERLPVA
jgi:hypothetical protein